MPSPAIHKLRLSLSNAFLVLGDRPVLVDAGSPGEADKIVAKLAKLGVAPGDLSLILLTHAHTDHAGSAKELRERSGAPVALHPADGEMLRRGTMGKLQPVSPRHRLLELYVNKPFEGFDYDRELVEGQRLDEYGLAGQIVHTPGHCAGSLSVVLDRAAPNQPNDALVGDLVIGGFLGGLINKRRPRVPYFVDDLAENQLSLANLLQLTNGQLHCGHGGPLDAQQTSKWLEIQRQPMPVTA